MLGKIGPADRTPLYQNGRFHVDASRDFAVVMSSMSALGRVPRPEAGPSAVRGLYDHALADGKVTRAEMLSTLADQASAFEELLAEQLRSRGVDLDGALEVRLDGRGQAQVASGTEASEQAQVKAVLADTRLIQGLERMAAIASHIRTGEAATTFDQAVAAHSPTPDLSATYATVFTLQKREAALDLAVSTIEVPSA